MDQNAGPSPTITAPPPRPQPPGPTGAATMRPQSEGIKEAGYPMAALGAVMFSKALNHFGPDSDEGRAIRKALEEVTPHFGTPSSDLTKQSMKLLASSVNPMGTPGPDNVMAMQDAMRTKMRAGGVGKPALENPAPPMPGAA